MTSLKTGYLLFLTAFLFLSIVPTVAEVVNSVAECNQYLLEENPPQLPGILEGGNIRDQNRYKPICQTYKNQRRFLTLYDITNKIPVFSAYKYIEIEGGDTTGYWKIEPQLEDENEPNKNLEDEVSGQTYTNQASSTDYESEIYDKGHLYPKGHASTGDDKESTYTLTNIVPQAKNFNQGRWNKMETCIKRVMNTYCRGNNNNNNIEGFVVTGAQPGPEKLKDKVNIPSIIWSAFCCHYVKNDNNNKNNNINMWIASAHWDNNIQDGAINHLHSKTLTDLYNTLGGADLFPGTQCPDDKKLEDYQELKIRDKFRECKP